MKASSCRKILAACLALLLVSGSVPAGPVADLFGDTAVTASAADNQCGANATWSFDSTTGTLTISGTGTMYDYDNGTQPWYGYKDNITSVEIGNGITSIGNCAFNDCKSLTSVTLPDSVTSIGEFAFAECTGLTSIKIPDSVTSIGESAFTDCYGLESVEIGSGVESIGQEAFKSCCDALTSITIPDSVKSIGPGAFQGCTSLKSITIPEKVTSIGESAFVYCESLESVEIGSGVESIGPKAFFECKSLTSVTIPDSVKSIGEAAFASCEGLKSIEIGSGVKSIDGYAFQSCTNLTSVTIPDSVTSIGNYAFDGCSSLTSITIPPSVTSIGKNAFKGCTGITDAYFYPNPKNLSWDTNDGSGDFKENKATFCHVPGYYYDDYTTMHGSANVEFTGEASGQCGENAYWMLDFEKDKLLITGTGKMTNVGAWHDGKQDKFTSVEIENGITSIGDSVFDGFSNLTSVSIPDSVTSIGDCAFSSCESLTSITIPGSVTSIGVDAFWGCTGITDVYCYADPSKLTWNEDYCDDFKSGKATICHVPAEYLSDYNTKFGNIVNVTFCPSGKCGENAIWSLNMDTGLLTISGSGAMKDYEFGDQPWQSYVYDLTSVVIENGITSIGNNAFNYCTGLTSITIPDSVKSIGEFAFADCYGLESVEIGSGVESIGQEAFKSCCDALTSITIPDSVKSIGPGAFQGCTSLKSITIPEKVTSIGESAFVYCESLESVEIGSGVESIGPKAFSGCTRLTSVTIPDSVTSIGYDAFFDCTNITDVYCYAAPANLTWDEYDCNDFKEDGSTVCHVPKEYIKEYNTKFGAGSENPVNVTFVGDIVDMGEGIGEHLYGHSISLEGDIGVNFYLELSDELLASETAKMVFTVPDGSKSDYQELFVSTVIQDDNNKVTLNGKTYYKFKCRISAKDMASNITAQLVDGEKSGKEYTYSVKEYAEKMIAAPEKYLPADKISSGVRLVKSMLDYGYYAREYFKEGSEFKDFTSTSVEDVRVSERFGYSGYYISNRILPEGVTFEGSTLSLKSETTLSLYFKGLSADKEFVCDDHTVETDTSGDYVIARVRGINAKDLENDLTVTDAIDGEINLSVKYNPMTYCYNVQQSSTAKTELKNVCCALYEYAEAAKLYFN